VSFTFSIEGVGEEHGHELPCKGCGVSLLGALEPSERRHLDCPVCLGYGGAADEDLPKVRYELHVHNGNGAALLSLLQLDLAAGQADPVDLLVKLTLARIPRCHEAHAEALSRIATQARKYSRNVVWG
jgi:hypothetical protein